jgi:hypothetical protein
MANHFISLKEAIDLTSRYRKMREEILSNQCKDRNILPICETFDRAAFDTLLDQDKCRSIRVYFGMDEKEQVRLVIVGVDENGNDILEEQDEEILEDGIRCPDSCPLPSPLNGQ